MKPNELRIGNYVLEQVYERGDISWLEIQIEYIDHDDNCEYIKPIELTEQWLTDFGFEKRPVSVKGSEFARIDMGGMAINNYGNKYWFIVTLGGDKIAAVEYIHQLQNLYFALTGKELTTNS